MAQAGFLVGLVGDAVLQVFNETPFGNDGLRQYFAGAHPIIRLLQAGLLTSFWSGAYYWIGLTSASGFVIWAALVDVLYRYAHPWLFSDLASYYAQNTLHATIVYNVVTAGLVMLAS